MELKLLNANGQEGSGVTHRTSCSVAITTKR